MPKDITITCQSCDLVFTYRNYSDHKAIRKFCSSSCRVQASKTRVKVDCFHCNNSFLAFPSSLKKGYAKFCSMKCTNDHKSPTVTCIKCQTQFKKYLSKAKHSKSNYCSTACRISHRNYNITCVNCLKSFHIYLYSKIAGKKFCSKECYEISRTKNPIEYFFKMISSTSNPNNCWEWTGKKDQDGYGIFYYKRSIKAHRYSIELYDRKIPEGFLACHKCNNPSCVNPDHIYIGTHQQNMDDKKQKYRNIQKYDI